MRSVSASRCIAFLLLSAIPAASVCAQTFTKDDLDESIRVILDDGVLRKAESVACPGQVFVGGNPYTVNGQTSTTSVTDVPYTIHFELSNTTLSGTATSNRGGDLTAVVDGPTTTFHLETTVTVDNPVTFQIATTSIAPGPAHTYLMTKLGSVTLTDEACEFTVLQRTYTLDVTSFPEGAGIDIVVEGQPDTATTPFIREIAEDAQVSLTAPDMHDGKPFDKWQGNKASLVPTVEFVMERNMTEQALFGEPPVADFAVVFVGVDGGSLGKNGSLGKDAMPTDSRQPIIILPPDSEAILRAVLTNFGPDPGAAFLTGFMPAGLLSVTSFTVGGEPCTIHMGSFSCDLFALAPFDELPIAVGLATGPNEGTGDGRIVTVVSSPATDPVGENNGVDFGFGVVVGGGFIHVQKYFDADGNGSRGPTEFGINGILIQVFDENNALVDSQLTHSEDLDFDGIFDPLTEQGLAEFSVFPGMYTVTEQVGSAWTATTPVSVPVQVGEDQEVEVVFGNTAPFDWGDLPDSYGTTASASGAAHAIFDGLSLGTVIDEDPDGQPSPDADLDDLEETPDDEDGLTRLTLGANGDGEVTLIIAPQGPSSSAVIRGWIDFDNSGDFDSVSESIVKVSVPANRLVLTESFTIPAGGVIRYARFRIADTDVDANNFTMGPTGVWSFGEVEDYRLLGEDYGDAPDAVDPTRPDVPAGYPTRLVDDGARHIATGTFQFGTAPDAVPTVRLGDANDGDFDGHPSVEGDGDDRDRLYDEEGILFDDGFIAMRVRPDFAARNGRRVLYGITRGSFGTIIPLASIQGKLDAWVDFNRDGDWDDAGEQIFDSEDVQTGPDYTPLPFDVPANASPGFTFARFRFSLLGNLEYDGPAPNGEVEDYLVRILNPAVVMSPEDSGPGSLRELIAAANLAGVPAIIDLRLLGKRDEVIFLQSPLPTLTATVDIVGDGTVTIDGSAAGAGADGLRMEGDGSSIAGVGITGFSGHGVVVDADDILVQNSVITSNGGDGVRVLGARAVLLGNDITGNGGLAVDRAGDGPTANDVPDTDGISNSPVVMAAIATDSTRIAATLSAAAETGYIVEFFASPSCGSAGKGGGMSLGSVAAMTDAAGHADVSFATDVLISNFTSVSATATGSGSGTSEYASCFTATDTEGEAVGLPNVFRLAGNYPNPFNPTTKLQVDLPEHAVVTVAVFDVLGRQVLALAPRAMEAGTGRSIPLEASGLSSGVYVYKVEARGRRAIYSASGRMTLIK